MEYWVFGYGALAVNVIFLIVDQSIIYGVSADVDTVYSSKSGNGLEFFKFETRSHYLFPSHEGVNLLKLLDGKKASHGEKTLGQGPHMLSNLVDLPSDLGSFGNEFELPKGNFEFGSSFGVFGMEMEQAYGNPHEQQGYKCLNDQPNLVQELAIAQSLNADMEHILCNLRVENEGLKAKYMDQDSAHMEAASKVPMLKSDEFELWRIRIEQYI
ncbi:hypothetical protein Tco_0332632 [Tanacetum coccineum]